MDSGTPGLLGGMDASDVRRRVHLEEAHAVLAALALLAGNRERNLPLLAELLSRRGLERPCEALVASAQKA
jgi:hypothetical protein